MKLCVLLNRCVTQLSYEAAKETHRHINTNTHIYTEKIKVLHLPIFIIINENNGNTIFAEHISLIKNTVVLTVSFEV